MKRALTLASLAAAIPAFSYPAQAQNVQCGAAPDVFRQLEAKYGETPIGRGVMENGTLLILTVNEATRSWTAVVLDGDGVACIPAAGDGWEEPAPVKEGSL